MRCVVIYGALCLLGPPLWAMGIARLFGWWTMRCPRDPMTAIRSEESAEMYHI